MVDFYADDEAINESPTSPTHYRVSDVADAKAKLRLFANGVPLPDLALDYLNSTTFGDLYILDRVLGAGTFGVVLKAVERATGREYAVKVSLYYAITAVADYTEVQPA